MSYKVLAEVVLARDREGHVHHVYKDGVISWLSTEQAEHFLSSGLVEKVSGGGDSDDSDDDGAPAKAAPKSEWVEFAVEKGYDRDEVEAMTKADIQALDFDE